MILKKYEIQQQLCQTNHNYTTTNRFFNKPVRIVNELICKLLLHNNCSLLENKSKINYNNLTPHTMLTNTKLNNKIIV